MSPPHNIRQLQCLQGMANFLRRFVVNFANLTKGFMRLLNKETNFCWDERAQESFDALKRALALAPMLSPLDYGHEFLIYVSASMETIGMVLVQEDDVDVILNSECIHPYFLFIVTEFLLQDVF